MSFGFSAGDFIAALKLVGTVVGALREAGGADAQYREVIGELLGLETALLRVKSLEAEEEQRLEYVAIRHAAAQCQNTIDQFLSTIARYQKHLGVNREARHVDLRATWRKVQWAMCKQSDVAKFKTDLQAHTQSITLLMLALQTTKMSTESKKTQSRYSSLSRATQDLSSAFMQQAARVTSELTSSVLQGRLLLEYAASILNTNIRIFQVVCQIQKAITNIPAQVERQQPVFLVDAIGRTAPFHLEFIRSAEAFKAVLKINFKSIEGAPSKIQRNEFLVQESASRREIDLNQDWDACFLPGQKVEMSMIFERSMSVEGVCPGCLGACDSNIDEVMECSSCGIQFQRMIKPPWKPNFPGIPAIHVQDAEIDSHSFDVDAAPPRVVAMPAQPPDMLDGGGRINQYRRVRLRERLLVSNRETTKASRANGRPWKAPVDLKVYCGEIIDFETFKLNCLDLDDDSNREFTREIVTTLFDQAYEVLGKLEMYRQARDLEQLGRLADYFKESAHWLGITRVEAICHELQLLGQYGGEARKNKYYANLPADQRWQQIANKIVSLAFEFGKAREILQRYFEVE